MNMFAKFPDTPWPANGPESWPRAPVRMTFSTLREIEACPRRWALSTADYPTIWDNHGYPPRMNIKSLGGTVIHIALEMVTGELAKAGCTSLFDASAVAVLQRLGGLSKVVGLAIDQLTSRNATNPRFSRLSDYFARSLRAQVPKLRGCVQAMLARRALFAKPQPKSMSTLHRERGPLGFGVYCELDLCAPHLGWKGRADLLALGPDSCEITDFKTGEPSDDHALQIRIYATLWNRDEVLNPTARVATLLVLAHAHGDIPVPAPTGEEISAIEAQLLSRGATARNAVANHPPEAKPSSQQCCFCGVRHLCDTYWRPEVQQRLADESIGEAKTYIDAEVLVHRQHGPKSWDVQIGLGVERARGLLRITGNLHLQPGQKLRILDATEAVDDERSGGFRCLTIGVLSEVFVLSSSVQ